MNDYQIKQAACKCLSPKRRGFIQAAMDFAADFNDGAFLAYMEEQDIDVSELEPFSLEHDCSTGKGGTTQHETTENREHSNHRRPGKP